PHESEGGPEGVRRSAPGRYAPRGALLRARRNLALCAAATCRGRIAHACRVLRNGAGSDCRSYEVNGSRSRRLKPKTRSKSGDRSSCAHLRACAHQMLEGQFLTLTISGIEDASNLKS